MMVGCEKAISWVMGLCLDDPKEAEVQDLVVNRMVYEFEKDKGTPPKYHKGKYGTKYDSWTCGNCGAGLPEPYWKFCPNCGYRVGRKIYFDTGVKDDERDLHGC